MSEPKLIKGFETAGKMLSAKDLEELDYFWMDKTFEEKKKGMFGVVKI